MKSMSIIVIARHEAIFMIDEREFENSLFYLYLPLG